jgi:hypothetical protein
MNENQPTFSTFYTQKRNPERRYNLDQIKEFVTGEPFKFVWTNKLEHEPSHLNKDEKVVLAFRKIEPNFVSKMEKEKLKGLGCLSMILSVDGDTGKHKITIPRLYFQGSFHVRNMIYNIRGDTDFLNTSFVHQVLSRNVSLFFTIPHKSYTSRWNQHWSFYYDPNYEEFNGFELVDYSSYKYRMTPPSQIYKKMEEEYQLFNECEDTPGNPLEKMFRIIRNHNLVNDRAIIIKLMDKLGLDAQPENMKDYAWLM